MIVIILLINATLGKLSDSGSKNTGKALADTVIHHRKSPSWYRDSLQKKP